MLQYVKHGDAGAARWRERSAGESGAYHRHTGSPPSSVGGFKREIQAGETLAHPCADALPQHLKEQSSAAPDIENDALLFRLGNGSFDEMKMIAEHKAPVGLLQPVRCGLRRNKPIFVRVVLSQFRGRGLRMQTDQAAIAALDHLKHFRSRAVEAVGGGEKHPALDSAARRTDVGIGNRS